jgi:hypothetical protein
MVTLTKKQHSILLIFIMLIITKISHWYVADTGAQIDLDEFLVIIVGTCTFIASTVWAISIAWTTLIKVKD